MKIDEMNRNFDNCDISAIVPHCPVMLVLDTSHSMWGEGLTEMMVSLKAFYRAIGENEFPDAEIDIAAVSMGDNLGMLEEFTPFLQSVLPGLTIRPKGNTPIGAALRLALERLKQQLFHYRNCGTSFVTPQLIVLSDGESSDDFSVQATRIRQFCSAGKLNCYAIALGKDADSTKLAEIAGNNVLRPNYQQMRHVFAHVGSMVSQSYEQEAPQVMQTGTKPAAGSAKYLLDGSNIMHWTQAQSGVTLKHVLAITNYLEQNRETYLVMFDATARYQLPRMEAKKLEELLKRDPEHFQQVPAGTRADDFLLMQAHHDPQTIILSRDRYKDYKKRYPWVEDKKRVVPGMVLRDFIFFPGISLNIPLNPPEKREAWNL